MSDDKGEGTLPYYVSQVPTVNIASRPEILTINIASLFERIEELEKKMQELETFVLLRDKSVRNDMRKKICAALKGEERQKALRMMREFVDD